MPPSPLAENPGEAFAGKVVFADSAAGALLAGRLEELRDPARFGWEQVKHNASRTVYRGQIDGKPIYVKHFHSRSLAHRLRRWLGRSDARREMHFGQYLRSCGVSTAPVLAAMFGDGTEWLATRAVAPAEPADAWHLQQLAVGARGRRAVRRATKRLGRLVGRMHAAGVIHRDLHCGNILVRTDTDAPQFVLTDLHRAVRRRRLRRSAKAANLAQLFHDRHLFTTRTERLRFLRAYLQASGGEGTLRGWQLLVETFARRHTRRQYAQRDRRTRRRNRYFSPIRLGRGWRGHVVLASKRRMAGSEAAGVEFALEAWRAVLAKPEVLLEGPGGQGIKDSRSSLVVRRRLEVGRHTVDAFIKRQRRKRAWKIVVDCFRYARALRAFRLGHALLTRHIATALPLAALERRIGPFLLDSILITETVDGVHLDDFLQANLGKPRKGESPMTAAASRQLAQEVLWQLGRLVQRLHHINFAHRDLKATNVLVRWSPGRPPEVVLVDLDGLRRNHFQSERRRFQSLMRLNVSLLACPAVNHAGRLRMLLGYLRRPGSGRINFKPYWRVLESWSARKLRQQIRSRRKRQKAVRRPTE